MMLLMYTGLRIRRMMREDNLLCVRKRKFVVTTDSNHGRRIYPNRARNMSLTSIDQLWVADITYICLRDEFVFLAVILDAYSRRVIGWALDRTLEDDLTLGALRMALDRRLVGPGLVHHSDRGTQYASTDYTDLAALRARLLAARGVRGEPRDPDLQGGRCAAIFLMGFPRHKEIFPPMRASTLTVNAPAHRSDEFPAGYSAAGCSPAGPASASPTGSDYAVQSSCRSSRFHRTANSVLTACVSRGDKRILGRSTLSSDVMAGCRTTLTCLSHFAVFEAFRQVPS
jgi:hypothetical protein